MWLEGFETDVSVREVLNRPTFKDARLIAGASGVDCCVKWVHIVESNEPDYLLNGEELVLTTGIPFRQEAFPFEAFIAQLVRREVSALYVELGTVIESLPEAMVTAADKHGLPLIVFTQIVRFIEITQDLHALILHRHHSALEKLEKVSREFNRMTLSSQGIGSVIKLLATSTSSEIIYWPLDETPLFFPPLQGTKQPAAVFAGLY